MQHDRELEKEVEEKRQIVEQRKRAVHHAGPVKQYKNVVVKKSSRLLTKPQTPRFSKRLRRLERH